MTARRFFSPILVILLLFHVYIGVRLLAPFSLLVQMAGAAVLALSLWLLPKGFRPPEGRGIWAELMPWLAVGFFSWLIVLTFARDFSLLAVKIAASLQWLPATARGEWSWQSALGVMALTPLVTIVGYLMARRVAPVVDVDVRLAGLPAALEGFTIAQISDVHVGPTIKRDFVEAIVGRVNGMKADMVAITGDLVDGSVGELAEHTAPLARLESRHGTYFVTGNHEYYSGARAWINELERLGARVLLNEHVVLDHDGAALAVAGVTDFSAHHFHPTHQSDPRGAIEGAPDRAIKVLLAHQPRTALAAADAGYHLQLSGHTHGGQFWPWNLFVRLQQPFTAGLNQLGRMWVYVNSGTGYWGPPMRFGVSSEITRIRLVAA